MHAHNTYAHAPWLDVMYLQKGGRDAWDNLVTACNKCNQAKGHKTLAQMGWRLKVTPREPSAFELGIVVGMHQGELDRVPQVSTTSAMKNGLN